MKNLLNVIADIITLIAMSVAAVGHVLHWYDFDRMYSAQKFLRFQLQGEKNGKQQAPAVLLDRRGDPIDRQDFVESVTDSQQWHGYRSGAALGILALLVMLSLVVPWGPALRRLLNLLMFGAAFTALLFQILFLRGLESNGLDYPGPGYFLALVPTSVAIGVSLIRMIWTMPPGRLRHPLPESPKPVSEPRAI